MVRSKRASHVMGFVVSVFEVMKHGVVTCHVLKSVAVKLLHSPTVGLGVQVVTRSTGRNR